MTRVRVTFQENVSLALQSSEQDPLPSFCLTLKVDFHHWSYLLLPF